MDKDLPTATEEILKQIINHDRVNKSQVILCDENRLIVKCDWQVNLGSRDVEKGISNKGVKATEPVCWHIPFDFPSSPILPSLRKDFPRNCFPHINPSQAYDVVWPCITESSVTSFLLANGLSQLLIQLDSWLDRAAQDRLMVEEQGWEPIIFNNYGGSFTDVNSELISFAATELAKQSTKGNLFILTGSYEAFRERPPHILVSTEDIGVMKSSIEIIPVILPESSASSLFQNLPVRNRNELISFAASLEGTPNVSSEVIVIPKPEFTVSESLKLKLDRLDSSHSKQKAQGCVVVFCIPRPIELIGGNSNIEIIPFFVRLTSEQGKNPQVIPLSYIQGSSRDVLQKVSHHHNRDIKKVAFLGVGSVGSKLALSLARTGSYALHIMDKGDFRPHNMARHGLTNIGRCEGWPKAILLKSTVDNWGVSSSCSFEDLSKNSLTFPKDCDVLIESTGNELVSYNLAAIGKLPGRLYQVGLYGQSTMGYLAIEPSSKNREVKIDDIESVLYTLAMQDPDISSSLFFHKGAERQIVGHGCSSETTIMPDTALNLCCAAITEKIDKSIYQTSELTVHGELHLCFRKEDSSINWKSYSIPPTTELVFKHDNRHWDIRISGAATNTMFALQKAKRPKETGGAIIGRICELTGRIFVTGALMPFEQSVESPVEFSFNQTQLHDLDCKIRESSQGQIYVIGTWHSHITPSLPSELDRKTLKELNSSFNLPVTVMLMCNGKDILVVEHDR
ncbi:Mov34/MPN/PAD-1 family protein [Pseudoalteromonas sp. BZB3]